MKINKDTCISPRKLYEYLKTKKYFGKIENEILAVLTFLKIYRDERPGEYLIYFKPNKKYFEIDKLVSFDVFFECLLNEDSPIDVSLIRKEGKEKVGVKPIQLKRFGLGKEKGGGTETFLSFLEKYRNVSGKNVSLVIVLEEIKKLKPQTVTEWLNKNDFPFPEVVLIHPSKNEECDFYQLKPSSNATFQKKTFTRKEIISAL